MNGANNAAVGDGGVTNTTTNKDERRQEVSNSTTNHNMFMEARETISMKTVESPVMRGDTNLFSTAKETTGSIPTKTEESPWQGGFSTAKEYMESIPTKSEETTAPLLQPGQSSFDVLLKVRGLQYHKENLESLESSSLHRDVKNLYGKFVVLYTYGMYNFLSHYWSHLSFKMQTLLLFKMEKEALLGILLRNRQHKLRNQLTPILLVWTMYL